MELEAALVAHPYAEIRAPEDIEWRQRLPRRLRREPAARFYVFGQPGAGVSTELDVLAASLHGVGYTCARLRLDALRDLSLAELHLALAEAVCAAGEDEPFGPLLEFCPPLESDTISLYPLQRISEWRREIARRPSARRRFLAQVERMEDSFFERVAAGLEEVNARLKAEGGGLVLILDDLKRLQGVGALLFEHPARWATPIPMIFAPPLDLFHHAPERRRALLGALPPAARPRLFEPLLAALDPARVFAPGAQAEAARWIASPGDLFTLLEAAFDLVDPPFTPALIREAALHLALARRDGLLEGDDLPPEGARLTPEALSRLQRGLWITYTEGGARTLAPHPLLLGPTPR
ncbi:hypothetical protein KKF91_01415 [Myxococcota bacterium]|nr:hypothetical protein [Myxococcota bacterium]MBU1429195.1 hypothetical protein [Myxococcota bacterium]MBU1899691.1 hypothetical protein [Myxococcota bacterium]